MSVRGFAFDHLLQPIGREAFLAGHREKRPLHVSRRHPDYYRSLFSVADLDALLAQSRPRFPQVRVVSKGRPTPFESLLDSGWMTPVLTGSTSEAQVNSLYDLYADGYTVVVELEKLWRTVSELARNMDAALNHKTTAELYMTPRGAQGFDLHFDHHDVFLLQIEGRKHWQVFPPVQELPVSVTPVSREQAEGPPLVDAVIEPGDLLYIPRGFLHQGFTSDTFSLHITFGVFVYRWQHLIVEALRELTERDARFRESLPLELLRSHQDGEPVKARLRELLEILVADHRPEAALEQLRLGFIRKLHPVPDGHFAQLNLLPEITVDSMLEKRAGTLCYVMVDDTGATMHFPGGMVRAPSWVEPALRYVAEQEVIRVGALPELWDDESRIVLARRLVKDGLLRIKER
jgi:ribosomal protein L16 Arg81 hydroxylase